MVSFSTRTDTNTELTLESTVEEVMVVEVSLTVVLESSSPEGLDITPAPCGLGTHTHVNLAENVADIYECVQIQKSSSGVVVSWRNLQLAPMCR